MSGAWSHCQASSSKICHSTVFRGSRPHVISVPFGNAHTCHVTELNDPNSKVSRDTNKQKNLDKNDDTHIV
jgi:hypothetical protein